MENFANCLSAAVIRHRGDDKFFIPMLRKGFDQLFLFPAFPQSQEEEKFSPLYGELEDWDAFDLAEAQAIQRHENPVMTDNTSDDGIIVWN